MKLARRSADRSHGNKLVFRRAKLFFQRLPGDQDSDATRGIAGIDYTVRVGGQIVGRGVTGADGSVVLLAPAGQSIEISIFGTTYAIGLLSEKPSKSPGFSLQRALSRLGYEAGKVDSDNHLTAGQEPGHLLLCLQADRGLEPDGNLEGETLAALDPVTR